MIKKRICVLTASRSDYSIIKPVILRLLEKTELEVRIAVTGMHLSPEFGMTYKEIEKDGLIIDKKIEMLLSADSSAAITKSMALASIGFADYFEESKPDMLLVLGDRYEILAVAIAAVNAKIPIIHISGGDVSEGAVDDVIRHSLTKMSFLHFTSTELHRQRVIQMGEAPERVFCVGATSVESAKNVELLTKDELVEEIGFNWGNSRLAVVTFHPVTLENNTSYDQCKALLEALDSIDDMKIIFTKANADMDGRIINQMIDEYVAEHSARACAFQSLGQKKYLSAVSMADVVVGNSSSGLSEVPIFHVPTVNVGDRQKNRECGDTVISCGNGRNEIIDAIKNALSLEFRESIKDAINPYEKPRTSRTIADIIASFVRENRIQVQKSFYMLK